MRSSALHLPAHAAPVEAAELSALDGGCCHGHDCAAPAGGRRGHHADRQDPACPWQHRHRELCALGVDCLFYAPEA